MTARTPRGEGVAAGSEQVLNGPVGEQPGRLRYWNAWLVGFGVLWIGLLWLGFDQPDGLVDHIEPAAPADDAIIAVALSERPDRIFDLHGQSQIA
jgi:hypothetical protein